MASSRTGVAVFVALAAVAGLADATPWSWKNPRFGSVSARHALTPGIFSVDGPGCTYKNCVFRPGQVYTIKGMGFGAASSRARLMSISLGRDNPDPYGNFPTFDNNLDLKVKSWSDTVVVVTVPDPLPAAPLRYVPISKLDLSLYPAGSDTVYEREVSFNP
jgi:hypothetical protein